MLRPASAWLILPATAFLALFFAFPSVRLLLLSFTSPALTLANYQRLVASGVYAEVLINTVQISALVALISVVLAYPVAFLLASLGDRMRNILLVAVVVPFFTSVLVRSYAWMVLLGREGIVNKILMRLGVIETPLRLIYNTTGLLISMTHILLPTAILLLLSVMRGIDTRLISVSASLGAGRLQTFLRVYLPLTLPGIGAAALLVFIFTLGNYVTPALLGGTRDMMLALVIAQQVNEVLNWPFAGALSTVLTGTTVALFLLFNRALNLDRMWGGTDRQGTAAPRIEWLAKWRSRVAQRILAMIDAVLELGLAPFRGGGSARPSTCRCCCCGWLRA